MIRKTIWPLGFGVVLTLGLLVGCGKSQPPAVAEKSPAPTTAPALRLHWLGKQRLASEANATNFMALWNLPESARLEAQTLDKLATAPWRFWQTNVAVSNAPTALLRPLLDDLVQAESYLEVSAATNQPGELVFAIRLSADRAALWETNFAQVLASLAAPGTQLPTTNLTLSRSGDWTIISATVAPQDVSSDLRPLTAPLLTTIRSRIAATQTPFPPRTTNYWVEFALDDSESGGLAWMPWKLSREFPRVNLTAVGDGQNVRTRGELLFPHAVLTNFLPWDLPLQLTLEPLTGLTATRSFKPILEKMGILSPEQARLFPDQLLTWIRSGPPLQMYFAYPLAGGSNAFASQAQPVVQWINAHAEPRRYGSVVFDATNQMYRWNGLQLAAPFLRFVVGATNSYVHGGFGITPAYKPTVPEALHQHIRASTNLIYFDWEHTADTLPQWRYLDDVSRMIFDAAHASRLRKSPSTIAWIQAIMTNLSHSITEVRVAAPNQLVLTRKSTLGLSSLELNILANWVSMPDFPRGMSSLWRPDPTPFARTRTNLPSATTSPK